MSETGGTTHVIAASSRTVESATDHNGLVTTYPGGQAKTGDVHVIVHRDGANSNRVGWIAPSTDPAENASRTIPDSRKIQYHYDAAGDLVGVTDRAIAPSLMGTSSSRLLG